jgi:hypothetical protein
MSIQFEKVGKAGSRSRSKSRLKAWWRPVLSMKIDDPQEEAPFTPAATESGEHCRR